MATTIRAWLRGPLLGAAVGLPVLGVGGRLVMRAIAVLTNVPPDFTAQGSFAVLLSGTASGAGGGALYALLAWLLPRHRPLRGALFAAALVLLTLRGLHPVSQLPLLLFMPLTLLYGALLELVWHRSANTVRTGESAVGPSMS